jgi:hypothetical protein
MEFNEQGAVALTLNTTKVCDVSPTTYIVQTPPQSMRACMNMNSLHILSTITGGGVSTIYKAKQRMQRQERQILKNQSKYKAESHKPFKTSPPLATIAEMGKKI